MLAWPSWAECHMSTVVQDNNFRRQGEHKQEQYAISCDGPKKADAYPFLHLDCTYTRHII